MQWLNVYAQVTSAYETNSPPSFNTIGLALSITKLHARLTIDSLFNIKHNSINYGNGSNYYPQCDYLLTKGNSCDYCSHRMMVPNTHLTAEEMADLSSHKTLSAALFRLQQSPGFFKDSNLPY